MKFHSFALTLLSVAISATTLVAQQPAKKTPAKATPKAATKPAPTKEKAVAEKVVVTFKNDTVFKNDVALFRYNVRSSKGDTAAKVVAIYNSKKQVEAMLSMTPQNDTTRFSARFISINKGYDCYYPLIGVETILESYVKNHILTTGGNTDSLGLFAYLKERNIPVREIPKRNVARPGMDVKRDSIMQARAKERMAKQFTFKVMNKGTADVMIFLGDTASGNSTRNGGIAFRQGRYETIGAGIEKTLTGFEGEFIAITNEKHALIDTRLLSKQNKQFNVSSDGKKLEE